MLDKNSKDDNSKKSNNFFNKRCTYTFESVKFPNGELEYDHFLALNDNLNKNQYLDIKFCKCDFLGKVNFTNLVHSKNISFVDTHFHEDVIFLNQNYENIFLFEGCTVHKKITFKNINFSKLTSFIGTIFKGKVDFIHTKFYELALFNNCKLEKLGFENTFFSGEANFLNLQNKKGKKLESTNITNRETARIIKNSFEKQNNIIEANKYYAFEMKKRQKEIKFSKERSDWLVFLFHRWSSNHSQNWIFPFGWIFAISFLYVSVPSDHSFCEGIYHRINLGSDLFDKMAKIINPFSIMLKGDPLNLGMLIFKVIIAYLMYQFVVSIRQNTRRK